MRTTLDISTDVMLAAKELAKREKKSAGQVISELARRGLQAAPKDISEEESDEEFFGFRPLPHRDVVITKELVDRLLEEDME
jgi:hypothetical protein